jgi:hypothetical protein
MVQGRDERLLHYGDHGTVTLDIHAVAKSQQLLAHGSDNGARPVLELEGLPEPQGLSVDEEGSFPLSSVTQKSSPMEKTFSRTR